MPAPVCTNVDRASGQECRSTQCRQLGALGEYWWCDACNRPFKHVVSFPTLADSILDRPGSSDMRNAIDGHKKIGE